MGEILIGYIGPDCNDDISTAAIGILLIYLCGSSISVLENTLVEKEQLCSMIYYSTDVRSKLAIWFSLSAVETEKLEAVERRLMELLKETASKPFDMAYMKDCITRWRRQIKMRCENAADFFSSPIIDDHLFGSRDGKNLKDIETLKELDELEAWSDKQWRYFMSKWLADANHVSILGEPSKELSDKITADEEARVKAQQERLGEQGLQELAEKLKKAQEENDKPIPDSVLESFPVPSPESVHFVSTTTARAGKARQMGELRNDVQDIIDQDDNRSELFMHFEQIPSEFVRMKLTIGTGVVPLELKPLIYLYMMNFFATPVMREGKRMEFEDVILQLEKETVNFGMSVEGSNNEMLYASFQTEPQYYASVIGWLKTLLFDAIHDPERLLASLTKILADIPDEKRSGSQMMSSINFMINYERGCGSRARDTLSKGTYLKGVKRLLKTDPEKIIAQFTELCRALHQPENFRVYVAADVKKLKNPVSSWQAIVSGLDTSKSLRPIDERRTYLSKIGKNPGSVAYVVPMGTIDSSFATLTSKGPDSYDHPDLAPLMVAKAYMDAVEGPWWVAVRGTGLAYGTHFGRSIDVGLVMFIISRSPDAFKAYSAAKEQVEGYASGKFSLDKFALEGAVSEIVLEMANEQPTFASAAAASYSNQVIRGIDKDWSHQMLKKVQAVTPDQIREVMKKYMLPAFQPETANLVITCAQIMKDGLIERFSQAGFRPELRTVESFQDDYGMKLPEGDEEDDDDDDEDDETIDTPESEEDDE